MTDDFSNDFSQIKIDPEKDYYQKTDRSRKSKFDIRKPKWLRVPEEMPIGLIGIVLFALVVLFILFFPRGDKQAGESYLAAVEQRLLFLEEKTAAMESSEALSSNAGFEKQIQKLEQRIASLEGSHSLRMNQLENQLKRIKRSSGVSSTKKAAASAPLKAAGKYHTVKKGETVYRIGLKYGLKPDEVRRLNKLGKDDKIFPGQRLIIAK